MQTAQRHYFLPHSTLARWIAFIALASAAAMCLYGPIPQWPNYHDFADARTWLAIPNAANVISNLPFAIAGIWSLTRLFAFRNTSDAGPADAAWMMFAAAVALTAVGSSYYHWSPSDPPLVFDRLPIAWACGALICALLAERLDPRWGEAPALVAAFVVGTVSVLWWGYTARSGLGDLRPYLWMQFLPMALVPLILVARRDPGATRTTPASAWWVVLALYGLAKAMELADHAIYEAIGISGHTLKHLLAAAGAWWLLRAASVKPAISWPAADVDAATTDSQR